MRRRPERGHLHGAPTTVPITLYRAAATTLTVTGNGHSHTTPSFTVSPAVANELAFTQSPGNSVVGVAFVPQPQVTVQDAYGNTVTTATTSITLAITPPGGATLTCTANPKAAVAGVDTFAGCRIDRAGTYTLTATGGGLTGAVSNSFTITAQHLPGQAGDLFIARTTGGPIACAYAVDGNGFNGTRWSSQFSDPQWIYVDLGQSYNITQVVLVWEVAYGRAFEIQTSNNLTDWTSIYSTTTGTGGTQTLDVTATGRYVRMYGTVRGTQWGYSLWEFQVFGY